MDQFAADAGKELNAIGKGLDKELGSLGAGDLFGSPKPAPAAGQPGPLPTPGAGAGAADDFDKPKKKMSPLVYVGIGCGVLLLLGIIAGGAIAVISFLL